MASPAGFLDRLRTTVLIAVVAGAVGSIALTLRAGRATPRLLLVLFVLWVLAPFVALAWATVVSTRWSAVTRAALYAVALFVTLGSLAVYGDLIKRPAGTANAFVFVVVPPVSGLLLAIVGAIAALIARRQSRRVEELR
jgi:hypothetical protein